MLEKNINNKIVLYCLLISIIFFSYHITTYIAIWYVGIVILLSALLFLGIDKFFLILIFLYPNENVIKLIGINNSPLSYVCLIACCIYLLFKFNKINQIILFLSLIYLIFIGINSIFVQDVGLILSCFKLIMLIICFCSIWESNKFKAKAFVDYYVFGVGVAIICGIVFNAIHGTLFSGGFGGIRNDRNYFNALVSPCITICLIYLINGKLKLKREKILYIVVTFLSLLSVILSGSRTCFIALIFPLMVIIFYIFKLKKIKVLSFVIGALIIMAIIIVNVYGDALDFLLSRIVEENVKSGNGRFEIWAYYLDKWINSGTIGILFGLGNSSLTYYSGEFSNVAHNTAIEYVYATGLLGTFSIFILITYCFITVAGSFRKIKFVNLLPLLNISFCYFGIDGLHSNALFIGLFVSFVVISHCYWAKGRI